MNGYRQLSEAKERIEAMIRMEENVPQRDAAGVYVPINVDAGVRVKAFKECIAVIDSYLPADDKGSTI